MCLTAPARVLAVDGPWAVIDLDGVTRRASLTLVPEVAVGDWVLVTAGLVLEVLDDAAVTDLERLLVPTRSTNQGAMP